MCNAKEGCSHRERYAQAIAMAKRTQNLEQRAAGEPSRGVESLFGKSTWTSNRAPPEKAKPDSDRGMSAYGTAKPLATYNRADVPTAIYSANKSPSASYRQ